MRKILSQLMLTIGLLLYFACAAADTFIDQLIVLNSDGQSYTAQQTLATDDDLIVINLPKERITLKVQFSGPEKITFEHAHKVNPDRLSIWSGSALTRYRHQKPTSITQSDSGVYQLTMSTQDSVVGIENIDALHASFTWVLPDEFELLSFSASEHSAQASEGGWSTSGNTVSFELTGRPVASLSIEFQRRKVVSEQSDPCLAVIVDNDECSPDIDEDQVPDYRDVCISINEPIRIVDIAATTPDTAAPGTAMPTPIVELALDTETTDSILGCPNPSLITLDGVQFQSGQSYLDVQARQVLDRVAVALQRAPSHLFEVASHTDNAGRIAHNQRLSENRADAVRHYLMLRGVGPNQLEARGYGETSPAHNNQLAAGRRDNRRVELRQIE